MYNPKEKKWERSGLVVTQQSCHKGYIWVIVVESEVQLHKCFSLVVVLNVGFRHLVKNSVSDKQKIVLYFHTFKQN